MKRIKLSNSLSGAATKFWNVADVDDEHGEIELYGDVVSSQPIDWWTGEPIPGDFISPEGFREDIEPIKDKKYITVKLNSCGGDLYTGIAIHNVLKSLTGEINVIVEGIAASAGSVIMCAGDTVSVYPGSLVMIHGVSVTNFDRMNLQDVEKLSKSMKAAEKALAEIYHEKTGVAVETLKNWITAEKWMTGQEAIDAGFADELLSDGTVNMAISADHKILMVNGINHDIDYDKIPKEIRDRIAKASAKRPKDDMHISHAAEEAVKGKSGGKKMTLEELKNESPELVSEIETAAKNAAATENATAVQDAVNAERNRLKDIDEIAGTIGDAQLVQEAKYGEKACTAEQLAFRALKKSAAAGQKFLGDFINDTHASGTQNVGAEGGADESTKETELANDVSAVLNIYNKKKGAQ